MQMGKTLMQMGKAPMKRFRAGSTDPPAIVKNLSHQHRQGTSETRNSFKARDIFQSTRACMTADAAVSRSSNSDGAATATAPTYRSYLSDLTGMPATQAQQKLSVVQQFAPASTGVDAQPRICRVRHHGKRDDVAPPVGSGAGGDGAVVSGGGCTLPETCQRRRMRRPGCSTKRWSAVPATRHAAA